MMCVRAECQTTAGCQCRWNADARYERNSLLNGWICPRCHKVNAPTVLVCDCRPPADEAARDSLPSQYRGPPLSWGRPN